MYLHLIEKVIILLLADKERCVEISILQTVNFMLLNMLFVLKLLQILMCYGAVTF